mmetsp:Transcript_2780/g.7311  ORF Transcript_2780/g.7311 Transcript_2780/m.7311 type:complete len:303 (+) Transcript_2780:1949-2857(+)
MNDVCNARALSCIRWSHMHLHRRREASHLNFLPSSTLVVYLTFRRRWKTWRRARARARPCIGGAPRPPRPRTRPSRPAPSPPPLPAPAAAAPPPQAPARSRRPTPGAGSGPGAPPPRRSSPTASARAASGSPAAAGGRTRSASTGRPPARAARRRTRVTGGPTQRRQRPASHRQAPSPRSRFPAGRTSGSTPARLRRFQARRARRRPAARRTTPASWALRCGTGTGRRGILTTMPSWRPSRPPLPPRRRTRSSSCSRGHPAWCCSPPSGPRAAPHSPLCGRPPRCPSRLPRWGPKEPGAAAR